jgi:hypothetical protein
MVEDFGLVRPSLTSLSLLAFLFSPSQFLSLLLLMVLKGEFEDGVGFEFMVLWIDFLGEPMWDWCCVRIKTMEIIDLWSKSQEAHGFGGIWLWVLPSVVDVVVTVVFEPLCVL